MRFIKSVKAFEPASGRFQRCGRIRDVELLNLPEVSVGRNRVARDELNMSEASLAVSQISDNRINGRPSALNFNRLGFFRNGFSRIRDIKLGEVDGEMRLNSFAALSPVNRALGSDRFELKPRSGR